jgi:hypothetical protein
LEASQTEQPKEFKLSFQYQPKQKALFQYVSRNGGMYLQLKAPQCLEVGGIRSGKTNGKLVYGIENYCLKYKHCDMLVLRRTISELSLALSKTSSSSSPKIPAGTPTTTQRESLRLPMVLGWCSGVVFGLEH